MERSSAPTDFDRSGEPRRAFVVSPLALFLSAIFRRVPHADAMLHIVLPLADVLIAVRVHHCAVAVFLALLKVTLIDTAIFVGQFSLSFKQVLGKVSFISPFRLRKVVDTMALEDAVLKFAFVEAAVGPLVPAASVFLALVVLAFELYAATFPSLLTEAVLVVVHPLALVSGSL